MTIYTLPDIHFILQNTYKSYPKVNREGKVRDDICEFTILYVSNTCRCHVIYDIPL